MSGYALPFRPLRAPWMRRFMRKVLAGQADLPGGGRVDRVSEAMRLANAYAGAATGLDRARIGKELEAFLRLWDGAAG